VCDWRPIATAPTDGRIIIVWDAPSGRWERWLTSTWGPGPAAVLGATHWRPDLEGPERNDVRDRLVKYHYYAALAIMALCGGFVFGLLLVGVR
jgi:hypothetical protein